MSRSTDWIDRVILPDLYPRKDDPYEPPAISIPSGVPLPSMVPGEQLVQTDVYSGWITTPGQRPVVYQRAANFSINVGTSPIALMNQNFPVDTIIISVPSTAANSVFFGYGSGVTTGSGLEVRPGVPVAIIPENTRELWEIQRVLESIAAMIAAERGYNPIGTYKTPRVVFNLSEYFLIAGVVGPTVTAVMAFFTPEGQ